MAVKVINEFRGDYYFLSNFYNAPVKYEGLMYRNSEAAFQSAKTANRRTREKFTELDPSTAKKMGRSLTLRSDWERVKDKVMEDILRDKFTRNPELGARLIATEKAVLVEGNTWHDEYWGVCLRNGYGRNMLGKLLMKIREELRDVQSVTSGGDAEEQ